MAYCAYLCVYMRAYIYSMYLFLFACANIYMPMCVNRYICGFKYHCFVPNVGSLPMFKQSVILLTYICAKILLVH